MNDDLLHQLSRRDLALRMTAKLLWAMCCRTPAGEFKDLLAQHFQLCNSALPRYAQISQMEMREAESIIPAEKAD